METAVEYVSTRVGSEVVVFEDSFEVGEWNGNWAENSQNDWFRNTQRASDGSWSAEVDGRATDATLTMIVISTPKSSASPIGCQDTPHDAYR